MYICIYYIYIIYVKGEDGPEVCQASPVANCWDGQRELDVDRDDEFNDDDIQTQSKKKGKYVLYLCTYVYTYISDDNPVVSFDRQKLVDLASSLGIYNI